MTGQKRFQSDCRDPGAFRSGRWLGMGLALALLFMVPGKALAQEEEQKPTKEMEAAELIKRIQEGMKKIDENLLNASTEGVKKTLKENVRHIEELLKSSRNQSGQVIQDLDELIRQFKYQGG